MKKIPVRQLNVSQKEHPSSEGFKIRKVEDIASLDAEKKIVQHLHRHDFFFILALEEGKGLHEIDFVPYTVLDHSIFLMRPGQAHKLDLEVGCTGFLLEFDPQFYRPDNKLSSQRLRRASNKKYCKLEMARFNRLQALLGAMFEEFTNKEEGYLDVIKASLDIFFIEFIRQSPNPKAASSTTTNPYTQERFEEFLELLEKNIATHKQVSRYSNLMNLSPYQLNEITKSSIAKTASELINDQILLEAKRYLLATSNQVKDIADHLGYEDVSYFIRFFKKHTGHSPEAFRLHFK